MSPPAARLTLHNYWRSSSSYRVRIALGLKGLPFAYHAVNLLKGEQHGAEYMALAPAGQVPTLQVEREGVSVLLHDSLAICEWLDETQPEPPLWPAERDVRAAARGFVAYIHSGIQPLHNLAVLKQLPESERPAHARQVIERGLRVLEHLATREAHRSPHLFGDTPTLAEVFLVPQLYAARRFGASLTETPRLLAAEAAVLNLPAFAHAHPDAQPDAVLG